MVNSLRRILHIKLTLYHLSLCALKNEMEGGYCMYEYKFVKVKLSGFKLEPEEDYEVMVSNYAKEGWRLMQVLAPPTTGYGIAGYYEFVFERQI